MTEATSANVPIHLIGYDETGKINVLAAWQAPNVAVGKAERPDLSWLEYDPTAYPPLNSARDARDTLLVQEGELRTRPSFPDLPTDAEVGDQIDLDLPAGTKMTWNGTTEVLDDGRITLDFAEAGEHSIALELWPYKSVRQTIEVG